MITLSAELTFHIPASNSLKDKRQVRRSLIDRARHRFNASIAEVATQDSLRTLTIGVAVVSGELAHARDSLDEIIRFMESDAQAELTMVSLGEFPSEDFPQKDFPSEDFPPEDSASEDFPSESFSPEDFPPGRLARDD